MNIKQIPFANTNYYNTVVQKKQIYLHHTAGNSSGEQVFQWWASNPPRIATFCAISGDGTIVQGFEPDRWAYHLGVSTEMFAKFKLPYINLDKMSIGIELCCWGQLTPSGTISGQSPQDMAQSGVKFHTYTKKEIPASEVIKLDQPFKSFQYWHSYTDAQIESLYLLLRHLNAKFNIPIWNNGSLFELNPEAFKGTPGLYSHNSVRKDKVDVYPHPKLVEMVKSL